MDPTTDTKPYKIAIVWRGDRAVRQTATPQNNRFHRVFEELAAVGIAAEPAVFDETFADEVREQLLAADGVLVWVNPLQDGEKTRVVLDPLLRDVAARGPWVSAHPDTILKMGTKEVLHRTRDIGWGADTTSTAPPPSFATIFRDSERTGRASQQNRGNDGQGVWKVELVSAQSGEPTIVRVLQALRGSLPQELPLRALIAQCKAYFAAPDGCIIDQQFQPRLPDGMIRCYMAGDKVAGFGHQHIKALIPPPPEGPDSPAAQPGPRIMHGPDAAQFQALRRKMEDEWTPQMMQALAVHAAALPIIWDADFLYGPRTPTGEDTYMLCEINVSSVFAIPDEAPAAMLA